MLLDLTVRPVQVLPDECPKSLVVRTLGVGAYVTGIVGLREDSSGYRTKKRTAIPPAAKLNRHDKTYVETRIPLTQRIARRYHPPDERVLPEPYEVASAYKDVTTSKLETAEIAIILEHPVSKGVKRCLATIQSDGKLLLTIVIKDYEATVGLGEEPVPLERVKKIQDQPMSAWERLLDDD